MRWRGRRESENIEDRRGMPGGPVMVGGGLGMLVIILIALFLGIDPQALLNMQPGPQGGPQAPGPQFPGQNPQRPGPRDAGRQAGGADDEMRKFVGVVLADTEEVWAQQFRQMGEQYRKPTLVLFTGRVQSACGFASAAVGPFYCPADQKVYLDTSFFDELRTKFRAPGEFAQAYVIAHEIGHHVQNLMGISDRMQQMRGRVSQEKYNEMSVRLELQADFLAGVWAHHANQNWQILEPGDIDSALRAASAIGDDTLQKRTQGYVVPDSFTHGTSEQRVRWFTRGLKSGRLSDGNTFETDDL